MPDSSLRRIHSINPMSLFGASREVRIEMNHQDASPTTQGILGHRGGIHAPSPGRRFERRSLDSALSIEINSKSLEGMADNISRVGLMMYTDQPLSITVQIDGVNGGRPITGRLIRLQRMDDTMSGVAIEFDELITLEDGE